MGSTKGTSVHRNKSYGVQIDEIVQMIVEISQFFDFSRWRPSAILDVWNAYLDHPQRVLSGIYLCANLAEIDKVVLIIRKFSYFTSLA